MEEIKVGSEAIVIDTRLINLVFSAPAMTLAPPIDYPGRLRLTSEATLFHAERVQVLHPEFDKAWAFFHAHTTPPSTPLPADPEEIRKMGTGARHLMGLIDLSLKLWEKNIPFAWVHPENYLHPGWQVALADLVLWFTHEARS